MRVVIDHNVFVSGLIKSNGSPGRLLAALRAERFELVTSEQLLNELESVLLRPAILALVHASGAEVRAFVGWLRGEATVTVPAEHLARVVRDPDYDAVLAAGLSGKAEYVVTGDLDLLAIGTYEGCTIVTPARFLAILETSG